MAKQVENIVFENNDIAGLYTIDAFEVRRVFGNKKFWEGMDEIIRLYSELHPDEMLTNTVANKIKRDENRNKFGSTEGHVQRLALQIPIRLLNLMKDYEPRIIKDDKLRRTLMKRYPALRGCDVV